MKLLQQLMDLRESDDEEDDYDEHQYDREKKVSLLVLKAFLKCGLEVSENEGHGGTPLNGTNYYVLYSEEDHEATVKLDEATLDGLVKLNGSGMIDGKCELMPSTHTINVTFKVHKALHSGEAKID